MVKYFYLSEGRTRGPVAPSRILDLILSDELTMDSTVMDSRNPVWKKINEIPELVRYLQQSDMKLPMSDIDLQKLEQDDSTAPLFFHIPEHRLIIGAIISCGVYFTYWLFKNWHFLRYVRRDNSFGMSFWRDMINPFRVVAIFRKITTDKELNRAIPYRSNFGLHNSGWLLTLLLGYFEFVFILPMQKYINACNAKLGRRYTEISFGHWLALGSGIVIWLFVLFNLVF